MRDASWQDEPDVMGTRPRIESYRSRDSATPMSMRSAAGGPGHFTFSRTTNSDREVAIPVDPVDATIKGVKGINMRTRLVTRAGVSPTLKR